MKKILVFFLFFSFIYNLNYALLPVHFGLLCGASGFLIFINDLLKKQFIAGDYKKYVIALLLIPLTALPSLFLVDIDFYFLREQFFVVVLLVFYGYLVLRLLYYVDKENDCFENVLKYIVYSVLLQCLLALVMFFLPSVKFLLISLLKYDELAESVVVGISEFRIIGFGTQFFGAGVINSIALLVLAYRIKIDVENNKSFWRKMVAYFFIFIVGMAMSRTTIIGGTVSIALLIYTYIVKSRKYYRVFVLLFIVFFCYLLANLSLDFLKSLVVSFKDNKVLAFGFEMIINLVEKGELSSDSTEVMWSMYEIIPDNMRAWLIGEGRFRDSNGISYFKHVDIGYLRILFAVGIIGFFGFILPYYFVCKELIKRYDYRELGLMLFLLYLLVLLKGIIIIYPIYVIIGGSVYLKIKKSH
ncbi:hypothetical protein ACKLNQ_17140 [Myroides odoratimimus]|uniref:hypothetical protein n=1 Tax=Myroides odoratimimus TaxID=76832 RepID=UPI0038D48E5E